MAIDVAARLNKLLNNAYVEGRNDGIEAIETGIQTMLEKSGGVIKQSEVDVFFTTIHAMLDEEGDHG